MHHRDIVFGTDFARSAVYCARRDRERSRGGRACAREIGFGECGEVRYDGGGWAGGEEESDGAVQVGWQEVGVGKVGGFGGGAECFGHYFCFAEEESANVSPSVPIFN